MIFRILIISILNILLVLSCRSVKVTEHCDFKAIPLDSSVSGDKGALQLLLPYKKQVDSLTSEVIGMSSEALTRNGDQSTLGNFVCDALRYEISKLFPEDTLQVVIMNRGGMRNNLPKGEIRVFHVFELMPFENELVVLKIKGASLKEFIPVFEKTRHAYSGFNIEMKENRVSQLKVGKDSLVDQRLYTILVSDYLLGGGDHFQFLKHHITFKYTGIKIRDAIISYCIHIKSQGDLIQPYLDERLKISK